MLKEQFADFLEIDEVKLISEWTNGVIIADTDPYSGEVYGNGLVMYKLVVDYLKSRIGLEEVEKLARRVAVQRMQAGINIGEFVYNVSLGRSIIFNRMYESGLPLEQLQLGSVKINECLITSCTVRYHATRSLKTLIWKKRNCSSNRRIRRGLLYLGKWHQVLSMNFATL
ncbi:histidine kinase N-terminal domain-containing protein [Aneurinibacillus tyrosinisolvens]|uniref:histidine kinase N-terminal domain-containing protein n=1 Tax=Aneurinibacillus tyrosinisolvens TaxID=1443435 RepID=UPI0013791FA7|nr:histidine kinase N-terminal domain-containing protein [Aneurinibacillus tyrosinisolvens]